MGTSKVNKEEKRTSYKVRTLLTKYTMTRLSEVPWESLYVGMPVISAIGIPGKIIRLLEHPEDRDPSIVIDWDNGDESWAFHNQTDKVTCATAVSTETDIQT